MTATAAATLIEPAFSMLLRGSIIYFCEPQMSERPRRGLRP